VHNAAGRDTAAVGQGALSAARAAHLAAFDSGIFVIDGADPGVCEALAPLVGTVNVLASSLEFLVAPPTAKGELGLWLSTGFSNSTPARRTILFSNSRTACDLKSSRLASTCHMHKYNLLKFSTVKFASHLERRI